jgi:hypothetical protein
LGERLLCKQEVIGSIPFTSTTGGAPHRWCATFGEEHATPLRGDPERGVD